MGGKKWCEYCRFNVDYTREAIQAHEQTRLHQQNKQRSIKHQMHQNRKQANANRKLQIEAGKANKKIQPGTIIAPSVPLQMPPKPKVSEERLMEYRKQQDEFKTEAFSKIHSLIAKKTKGEFGAPIQFPESNPLLLKDSYYERNNTIKNKVKEKGTANPQNSGSDVEQDEDQDDQDEQDVQINSDSDESEDVRMWRIQRCQQTGKPCFINNITGTKLYDKPTGFFLSDKEQQLWQQLQQQAEQNPQKDPNEEGNIGQWEEILQQPDYYDANMLSEPSQQQQVEQLDDIEKPRTLHEQQLGQIEEKILKGEITTPSEVVSLMIKSTTEQTGESLREKNARLKKLLESNFQETMTMERSNRLNNVPTAQELLRSNAQLEQKFKDRDKLKQRLRQLHNADDTIKNAEGFRPRKQVKKIQLTTQEDMY